MIQCDQCGRKALHPGNHIRWYLLCKRSKKPVLLCWPCRERTKRKHPGIVDLVEVRGRYSPDQEKPVERLSRGHTGMLEVE